MNLSLTRDEDDGSEDPLKKLLERVYTTHRNKLSVVTDNLSRVQEQLEQLEHDNTKLQSAIRSMTEENGQLLAENKQLEVQLRDMRQRPPPVCKECDGLRLRVKLLSGIKEQIFQLLDVDGAENKDLRRAHKVEINTLQSLYTQALDSEILTENPDQDIPPSPSPQKPTKPSVASRSNDKPQSKAGKIGRGQECTEGGGSKESPVKKVAANDGPSPKNAAQGTDEVSPKPRRNLKLVKRPNKRQRITEEGEPSSKRPRTLQKMKEDTDKRATSFHGILQSDTNHLLHEADTNVSNSAPPNVLVADTCDMSIDTSHEETGENKVNKNGKERKIAPKDRPNLIIPETVPMAFTDDEEEEDSEVIGESQPLSEQITVRNLDLSPPSLASTPVCSNRGYPLNLGDSPSKQKVHDVLKEAKDMLLTKNDHPKRRPFQHYPSTDSPSNDEDVSSDAGSPVFKRNPSMRSGTRQQSVQSPSLFDEDDADADLESIQSTLPPPPVGVFARSLKSKKNLHNRSKNTSSLEMHNKSNQDLSVSIQSNPSPSMLSGKILSKIKNSGNSEWLSTSVSKTSPQTKKASLQQGRSPMKAKDKLSGQTKTAARSDDAQENSSPVRMTRSKKSSQERGTPGKSSQERKTSTLNTSRGSNSKSLKQTTISQKFFEPVKTKLSSLEGFNGGRLAGSQTRQLTREEQELHDLEEAMQRSLSDLTGRQSQDDLGFTEMDVEMTQPQLTSTPFIAQNKAPPRRSSSDDSTASDTIFKKPSTPTTPKHRKPKEHDQDLRRSPRLKDEISQDDTIDPTVTSPETQKRSKTGNAHRKNASSVNRSLDLSKQESMHHQSLLQADSELLPTNGSLGPDVRLSEWDPEVSAVVTSPEAQQYQEPISLLDIYSAESENRTQSMRTQQTVVTKDRATRGCHDSDSDDGIELSGGSVVFKSTKTRASRKGHQQDKMVEELPKVPQSLDDSFDRVPKKKEPDFKYNVVVRKHAERAKLQTYVCNECDKYFGGDNATEEQIQERMKHCRHKARYVPPGTPENFWSVGFPDTQECEERGYMNKTQHKPSKHRRRQAYKSLFDPKDKGSAATSTKVSPGTKPRVIGDVTALFEGDDSQDDDD